MTLKRPPEEVWDVRTRTDIEAEDVSILGHTFQVRTADNPPPTDFPYDLTQEQLDERLARLAAWVEESAGVHVDPGDGTVVMHSESNKYGQLSSVLRLWLDQNDVTELSGRIRLDVTLEFLPIPTFGSPPSGWEAIGAKISGSAFVSLMAGADVVSGKPMLVVYEAGAITLIWFVKPSARVIRRAVAGRIAKALHTDFRLDDEL